MDASTIAATIGKTIVPALLKNASSAIASQVRVWDLQKGVSGLLRIKHVKPIWNPGKDTDLHEFYYPCPISVHGQDRVTSDLDDLPNDHTVLTGRVGQGKSILLRFLASNELLSLNASARGAAIPLFLELRQIGSYGDLPNFASQRLSDLGFGSTTAVFEHMAERGLVSLLLDGFDELPSRYRSPTVAYLERLTTRYPKMKVVVSSRPGASGVEGLAGYTVARLKDLDETTLAGVVRHQYSPETQDVATALLEAIRGHEVAQLAVTPLMAALLVVHFNTYQKIPEKFDSFHEDLFDALLRRHDATKPGFVRPRNSKMDDLGIRGWFDRCSFNCMKSGATSWPRGEMLKIAEDSLPPRGVAAGADAVLSDAVQVTGLILEEGNEYEFIHKSVMEYHAACCIKALSEGNAQKFYRTVRSNRHWPNWEEVLRFLSIIDRARYYRHFELGLLRDFVRAPTLHALFEGGYYSPEGKGTLFGLPNWLLQESGPKGRTLRRSVEAYFYNHRESLSYTRQGLVPLNERLLRSSEDDEKVSSALEKFVAWSSARKNKLTAELEELEDAEELLDLGDGAILSFD